MWTWLTSPPVLLVGLLASLVGIAQAVRPLKRWIVLFPRRAAERQVGEAVMAIMQAVAVGKPIPWAHPPEEDWSKYRA